MKDDGQRTRQQPQAKAETVNEEVDNDPSAELGAQRSFAAAPSNAAVAARAASSRGVQLPATSAPSIQTKRPTGPPAPVGQGQSHTRTWAAPPSGGGAPLTPNVRQSMEASFGADFSSVRVHQGDGAAESLGARAFARGESVHVASGEPGFDTAAGKELLGHELAHVVQQRSGKVIAEQGKGGVVGDPNLEAEADRAGAAVARGDRAVVAGATQRTTPAAVAVQAKRSKVGTRHRTKEYREKLTFNMDVSLDRIHTILEGGAATDRKKFINVADALSGLAGNDPDTEYKKKHGKKLSAALNTAYANKPWQLRYLQNLRKDSAPDPIDKLALYLGLVTHGKGARAAFRPGDPKRVLELLETEFPTNQLWQIFTFSKYAEFRVAITQLERIESQVADRIHALRRARGITGDAPATKPSDAPQTSKAARSKRTALTSALDAKKPDAAKIYKAAVAFVRQLSVDAKNTNDQRACVDYAQDRFVRGYTPPANPKALKQALTDAVCRYPLLERLARKLSGKAKPTTAKLEVEHLASIVRHHGRVGTHRFFSGASTDKLVEGVKRWVEHASEDACREAVKTSSPYVAALDEIGTGKVGRGLSDHSRKYLIELVKQAGVAHQPDPNKSDEENKQDRKTRDTAHELGLVIGREQTKEKHKKARLVRRRYKHTDLKAFIDGMDFAARMKYLLDLLPDTDRNTFNDKTTSGEDKKRIFERAVELMDAELVKAKLNKKERGAVRAKFTYQGDLGTNYLRLVELAAKYKDEDGDKLGKKVYSAVTKLEGNEYLQVRKDQGVVRMLRRTGRYQTMIADVLGLDMLKDSKHAFLDLEGKKQDERAGAAKRAAEHHPEHWSRLINYEIDKHSSRTDGKSKNAVVWRHTIHPGRLYSFVYRAQMAAKAAHANDEGKQKAFTAKVWTTLTKHSRGFIKRSWPKLQEHLENNTPVEVIERIKVADRNLNIHMSEIEQALEDASGAELLDKWSNYRVLTNLIHERAKAKKRSQRAKIDKKLDAFVLDLHPDVHKQLDSTLRSFNTTKPERLVKIVAAARRKLASAIADDGEFRTLLKKAFSDAKQPDRVDKVLSAHLRGMAAIPEERLRKKGIQWHAFTVLGDATSLKFSEFTGQHQAMDKRLGDAKKAKDTRSRDKIAKDDLKKIDTLEKEWSSLKADFEKLRAKYNKRLELLIDLLVSIALSAATAGIGTAASAAWWGKALLSMGAAVIKEVVSIVKSRVIEGGVDATSHDVIKRAIVFSLEQGVAWASAATNEALKDVYKEWMKNAHLGYTTTTEQFSGQSGGVGNVTFTYATKPGVARLAADAGWKTANKVAQTIVYTGPQKMLAELLEADPYQAVRKDFKTEAANYGVARLRQAVTTFTTSFTSSLASTAFNKDKLDEQEQHNKANAKAKAEKTALENSHLSGRVDPTKFAKYSAKYGGNKDIDTLYEQWKTQHGSTGGVQTPGANALTTAQNNYDTKLKASNSAKSVWDKAQTAYNGSSYKSDYDAWRTSQPNGGTVQEAKDYLKTVDPNDKVAVQHAQNYLSGAQDSHKVATLKADYDTKLKATNNAFTKLGDAKKLNDTETAMYDVFSKRDSDTTTLDTQVTSTKSQLDQDSKDLGYRGALYGGTIDPLITTPQTLVDKKLVEPTLTVEGKTKTEARKEDGDKSSHEHTRAALLNARTQRAHLEQVLEWDGVTDTDEQDAKEALDELDVVRKAADHNEHAIGTAYAPSDQARAKTRRDLVAATKKVRRVADAIEKKKRDAEEEKRKKAAKKARLRAARNGKKSRSKKKSKKKSKNSTRNSSG